MNSSLMLSMTPEDRVPMLFLSAQVAGDVMAARDLAQGRALAAAARFGIGAAGVKAAAGGRVDRARHVALEMILAPLQPRVRDWHRHQ